jgi:hypothetical protein
MRIPSVGILLLAAVVTAAKGNGGPFALIITGPQSQIRSGSPVPVRITLTNISDREITFSDTNRECDYKIEVIDQSSRTVPETAHKRELVCDGPLVLNRNVLVSLKPGQSTRDEIIVSNLYQMAAPGRYTVMVMRKVPKDMGQGRVTSNSVTITIGE